MFQFGFMQRALTAVLLLGTILPMIGLNMTTKRLSMIGDALSHTSLCGIAIGLAAGTFPIPWAIGVSIASGIVIEFVRNKFSKYAELTLAIVMSTAVGVAGILTSRWAAGNKIDSYFFGSLLTVQWSDVYAILAIFSIVLLVSVFFYRTIMYAAYSESEAQIAGVPVRSVNFVNTILVATVCAISAYIIGSLLVSSLLVIPVATSLQLFKSYRTTLLSSVAISLSSGFLGLVLSYVWDVNTGGTIVLVATSLLILALLYRFAFRAIVKRRIVDGAIR